MYPLDTIEADLVNEINRVKGTIYFTFETETKNTSTFVDIMLNKTNNDPQLKVYSKSTNKHNIIIFYFHHISGIISGIIIGLYL